MGISEYFVNGFPYIWVQVHRVDKVYLRILLCQSLYCPAYLDKSIAEVFPAMTLLLKPVCGNFVQQVELFYNQQTLVRCQVVYAG